MTGGRNTISTNTAPIASGAVTTRKIQEKRELRGSHLVAMNVTSKVLGPKQNEQRLLTLWRNHLLSRKNRGSRAMPIAARASTPSIGVGKMPTIVTTKPISKREPSTIRAILNMLPKLGFDACVMALPFTRPEGLL